MTNLEIAVRAEGLGKRYFIGKERAVYGTLRDRLTDVLAAPFRRAVKLIRGHATGAAGLDTELWALKDVSFEVRRGEVLGIIGSNGAGKSTLLKVLSRITEPTKGFVEIVGRLGSLLEVGTGFHQELTGRENIYLNGAILGMRRSEIEAKFDQIVSFAEIERFIDTPVKHFSSGMYVRLAFAVAAHMDPRILVVDEVLAVGDASFQQKCLGRMGEVAREGRTILFVSHNMATINRLCERVMWIDEGRMRMDGSPKQVIAAYLASDSVRVGKRVWAEGTAMPGVDEFLLDAVSVTDADGRISSQLDPGEPFSVAIEYRVLNSTPTCRVGFLLETAYGIVLFDSYDTDEEQYAVPRKPGRYTSSCTVPGNFLAPGRYFITVNIGVPNVKHFVLAKCALTIDVRDTPRVGSNLPAERHGLLLPQLRWQQESEPSKAVASE